MGATRTIYRNTAFLGAAEIISKGLQFLIMLYAARLLSKESFGKFNFALAITFIAVILADFGIYTYLVREISRNRKKEAASRLFWNSFFVKVFLSLISFLVIFASLNILGYPEDTKTVVYIMWAFTIILTFTELFYSVFRGFEMMKYDSSNKIVKMIVLAAISVYFLSNGFGVFFLAISFVLSELAGLAAAALIAFRKLISFKPEISTKIMANILKEAIPIGFSNIFGMVYFFIGTVMLSKMKGDSEVAAFSAAYNIVLALIFIPTVYTNAIYPVFSRYKKTSEQFRTLYEKSFKYLYMAGLPISAGIFLLSDRIIYLLYKSSYESSIPILKIISFFIVLKFLNFLLGTILVSLDNQYKRMLGQGLTAVLNIILNLIFIPKYGFIGVAYATIITEVFLFVVYYYYVCKNLYFYNFFKILIKPALACIVMALAMKFMPFGLVLTIILSAMVYLASITLLKTFDKRDFQLISDIFKNDKLQNNK
ncbi:MAG TPA: flippase [Candidatus Nanoarchaeia archaeon]|nr:flippase [Candidatus Nanoarchaeia archaeon]